MSPRLSDTLLRVQTDERLVALARDGHERAFVAIIERYRRPLLGLARRLVPEPRAEDVLQAAFVSAWRALIAGAEVRHLRGWLHQIVRHTAAKTLAGAPREEELSERLVGSDGVEAEAERRERIRDTLAGVAALPERQRSALVQTAVEGRSRVEVAASLGLSEGAVRQLVHRARATLRAAATAVTPAPLAQWAAQAGPSRPMAGSSERLVELAVGAAGSASAAGVAVKAGAVIAVTGAVAAGVSGPPGPRRPDAGPARGLPSAGLRVAAGAGALAGTAGPATAALRRAADGRPGGRAGTPGGGGRVGGNGSGHGGRAPSVRPPGHDRGGDAKPRPRWDAGGDGGRLEGGHGSPAGRETDEPGRGRSGSGTGSRGGDGGRSRNPGSGSTEGAARGDGGGEHSGSGGGPVAGGDRGTGSDGERSGAGDSSGGDGAVPAAEPTSGGDAPSASASGPGT